MPSFKLTWEAKLLKDATEDDPNGEHIGTYSGYVTFDNLLFAQKASTVVGEQMFQQIIEHSTMSAQEAAPEVAPVETANDDTPEAVSEVTLLGDTPIEPPRRMVPRRATTKKNNKKGA